MSESFWAMTLYGPKEFQGTLIIENRRLGKIYKCKGENVRGFATKRACQMAKTSQTRRRLLKHAREVTHLTTKRLIELKPTECPSFMDWLKSIYVHNSLPPQGASFENIQEVYEKHRRCIDTPDNNDPRHKKLRRAYEIIRQMTDDELDTFINHTS